MTHYLYLITRDDGERYVGVTKDSHRREWQHKNGYGSSELKDQNFTLEILNQGEELDMYAIEDATILSYNCSLNKMIGGKFGHGMKGSTNGMAKLVEVDIPIIIDLLKQGKAQIDIAAIYNVSRGAIASIASGKGWTDYNSLLDGFETKRKIVPQTQRDKIISLAKEGLSIKEISAQLDIKYATVYSHCRNIVTKDKSRSKLSSEKIKEILDLRKSGLSWDKIAKKASVSSTTARRYCKELL